MQLKRGFRFAEEYSAIGFKWIGYVTGIAFLFGVVSTFFEWGNKGPFLYLKNNLQSIWMWAITAAVLLLIIWTSLLRRRFKGGFRDNFKNSLQTNWDFKGNWRTEKGTLFVRGPDGNGGITKVGALWENYTFTFKACIIKDCLGVIIRAQDLDNYFMFQVRTDRIRSHRRAAVPMVPDKTQQQPQEETPQMQPIQFKVGWQIFDPPTLLNRTLNTWFNCKITVHGESICIRINDDIVLKSESFLKIPTGKVGFRNQGAEEAQVKNVKVVLEP